MKAPLKMKAMTKTQLMKMTLEKELHTVDYLSRYLSQLICMLSSQLTPMLILNLNAHYNNYGCGIIDHLITLNLAWP